MGYGQPLQLSGNTGLTGSGSYGKPLSLSGASDAELFEMAGAPTPIYQANLQPVPFPGPEDPGQFMQNTTADVGNMIQGMAALGSVGVSRIADTLPHDILSGEAFKPGYQSPKDWYFGASSYGSKAPLRPEDPAYLAGMGASILQGYNDDYLQPILRGDLGAIGNRFLDKPVSTFGDLAPLPGVTKGIVKRIPYSGELIDAAGRIVERVPIANKVQQILREQALAKEQQSEFARGVALHDYDYTNNIWGIVDKLSTAYKKVPENLREQLIPGAEMTDQSAIAAVQGNRQASGFLEKVNNANEALAAGLKRWGFLSDESADLARYGPSMGGISGAEMAAPHGQAALAIAKSADKQPVYMGRVQKWEVGEAQRNKGSMFSAKRGTTDTAVAAATDGVATSGKPGWLRERIREIRGDVFTKDALETATTRLIQGHRIVALTEFFEWVFENPKLAGDTAYSAERFFMSLAKDKGISRNDMVHFMNANKVPGVIYLPAKIVDKLNKLEKGLTSKAGRNNPFTKTLEKGAAVEKMAQLGLNIGWASWQTLQNSIIYGLSAFRGVQDIPASIMAMALAHDADVVRALPRKWIADLSEGNVTAANNLSKAFAPVLAIPNAVFKLASAGDNYWRLVGGIRHMLSQANKLDPQARLLMHEAFNLQANKASVLVLSKNADAIYEAGVHIDKWFGRYDQLFNDQKWALRMIYPYTNWYFHSLSILKALPEEVPFKTSLISRLIAEAPARFQDENVLTESELRSGAVVSGRLGPNGSPVIMNGNQLALPQATALEIARQILSAPNSITAAKANSMLLNWMLQVPFMMTANEDSSGHEFSSPELIKVKGMTFDQAGNQVDGYKPDVLHLMLRAIAPGTEKQIRETRAHPFKPSDATSVLNSNPLPRRDFSSGEPVKNENIVQRMVGDLTKLRGHEQAISKQTERQLDSYKQKEFRRAKVRQANKLEPVESMSDEALRQTAAAFGIQIKAKPKRQPVIKSSSQPGRRYRSVTSRVAPLQSQAPKYDYQ